MEQIKMDFTDCEAVNEQLAPIIEAANGFLSQMTGTEKQEAYLHKLVKDRIGNFCTWRFAEIAEDVEFWQGAFRIFATQPISNAIDLMINVYDDYGMEETVARMKKLGRWVAGE